jgi:hypothetical protein
MLLKASSNSNWTYTASAKCLCFKSWFIPGNKKVARSEIGQVTILFLAEMEAFCWHCRGSTRIAGRPCSIFVEDCRQCFQQWEWHWDHWLQSQQEYSEGDWSFKLVCLFLIIFFLTVLGIFGSPSYVAYLKQNVYIIMCWFHVNHFSGNWFVMNIKLVLTRCVWNSINL